MTLLSRSKGEIAQLQVLLAAYEKNFLCSLPTNLQSRYDVLIDTGKEILRAQIKYCDNEWIHSKRKNHHNVLRLELKGNEYTSKQIDLMLIYIPRLHKILAFPPKVFHNSKRLKIHLTNKDSKHYYEKYIW